MLIVIGFLCAAVHTQAATLRVGAGGEYTTIQAAIAAAEALDVVEVAPGTYTLTERIDIDKALTLRGPQADVDPRPHAASVRQAGSAAEAIIDGNGIDTLLRINVGEVEVNGFEFRNGRVDLIDSPSSAPIKENLIVRYNIIHNSLQDEGIQLKNTHNALIERNYVYNTYGDSINLSYSRFGTIRENECTAANADGANGAIYVYNDAKSSSSPTTNEDMNILIEGNYIHDVNNYGIYVGASGGQDQLIGGGTVKGNMVANSKESAIKIMTCNVVIKCNDVTAADSSSKGSVFIDRSTTNIVITQNFIQKNGSGYGVQVGSGSFLPSHIKIYGNSITGTAGGVMFNSSDFSAPVVAEGNWWGTADALAIANAMQGAVVFDPWLLEGVDKAGWGAVCFPPRLDDLGSTDVTLLGPTVYDPGSEVTMTGVYTNSRNKQLLGFHWEVAAPPGWSITKLVGDGTPQLAADGRRVILTEVPLSVALLQVQVTFTIPLNAAFAATPTIIARYDSQLWDDTIGLSAANPTTLQPRDEDGDGIADAWAAYYNITDPHSDSDGDGQSNLAEYLSGTNPLDPDSCLKMVMINSAAQTGRTIAWSSELGRSYTLQRSIDRLDDFQDVAVAFVADSSGTIQHLDSDNSHTSCFYRVKLQIPSDNH